MDALNPSKLVREARLRARMTQRALAKRTGTSESVVARIESGDTDPGCETLSRLLAGAGFKIRCELDRPCEVDSEMLADVPRILGLTVEQRLQEAANLSRFDLAVRRA